MEPALKRRSGTADRAAESAGESRHQILADRLNDRPRVRQLKAMAECLNAGRATPRGPPPIQRRANGTGLPDALKDGVESLSGLAMDDVRVHYNSTRPAQLQAHAYTQGTDIHLAPRQERHLPHEAWHVVQQKQGRVRPTLQLKNQAINDDRGLEAEADAMGAEALRGAAASPPPATAAAPAGSGQAPIQRRVGYEFETNIAIGNRAENLPNKQPFFQKPLWHAEPDRSHIEFVTKPLSLKGEVVTAVDEIMSWGEDLLSVPITVPKPTSQVSSQPQSQQAETPETPQFGVPELISKFGFTQEEAGELDSRYGSEVIANLYTCTDKREVLEYAPVIAGFMTKSAPRRERKVDLEEEHELAEHRAYRDLNLMTVTGEWLAEGLIAKGADEEMTASPQATIGTSLDEIGDMMATIPRTKLEARSEEGDGTLSGREPETGKTLVEASFLAVKAVEQVKNDQASDKDWRALQGMLALMLSYILTGQKAQRPFKEAKRIAPLMSRVNFVAMYKALAPEARKYLTPSFVAAAAGVDEDSLVFGKGFGKQKGGSVLDERLPVPGPSIKSWVGGLTGGTDLMSSGAVVDPGVEGSPSMGEQGELDMTESDTGLVPLELRRLPGGVPLADWMAFALQIFELSQKSAERSRESK